jgi:hypothetical protein
MRPTQTGVFHQHLEMIGANEPITKKARFWSSYVKSLGGTESIIGQDKRRPGQTSTVCTHRSTEEESQTAASRVKQTGYNYMPLYRNIYGHSPRRTGLKSIYA